jgi:DNA-binding NtrC family response regulator
LSVVEEARQQAEVVERHRIADALAETGGNQTRAAKLLGISRRTLVNRLSRYGISRPRKANRTE